MALSLDDAKEAKENAQQGNLRENDAGIEDEHRPDWDNDTVVDIKGHAESLVTFDYIANISINQFGDDENLLDLEQNLQGGGQYGYTLEITVANPEVIEGQVWVDDPDADFPNYKVISDPELESNDYELRESIIKDDDGNPVDTEIDGIGSLGPSSWDGKPVSELDIEFDPDYATFSIAAKRAADVLGALDTAGQWYTNRDGEVTEGLFEAPPKMGDDDYDGSDHGYPRLVGFPELRADIVGQSGAIAYTFGDGGSNGNRPTEITLFKVDGMDMEALVPPTPDDDAYVLPTYPRGGSLYWSDADDADAPPQSEGGMEEAQKALEDDETTYEELNDDEQQFVDDAVEAVEEVGYDPNENFEDFVERVNETAQKANITEDAETLLDVVNAQT